VLKTFGAFERHQLLVKLPSTPYVRSADEHVAQDKVDLQPYLLGPWAGVVVDPALPALPGRVGCLQVSHFTVKHACSLRLPLYVAAVCGRCGVPVAGRPQAGLVGGSERPGGPGGCGGCVGSGSGF
jgi:hypothetical protein